MKKSAVNINKELEKYIVKEKKNQYMDTRTRIIDEMPHVYPVGINNIHVAIVCPYCKTFHIHGVGNDKHYQGHRLSHCLSRNNSKGYVIEKI